MLNNIDKQKDKFRKLLKELFQFDNSELNFGIYTILNQKHKEIEKFIDEELIETVKEGLAEFIEEDKQELEKQLQEAKNSLGDPAFDSNGNLKDDFKKLNIAKEYQAIKNKLDELAVKEETEAHIFDDLYRFFSRYYDAGDFISKRRYSSKDSKFYVPYNGEEVLLHWANNDQYYTKTTEHFTDYSFSDEYKEYKIWFKLTRANIPKDNIKGDTRYFVLSDDDIIEVDEDEKTLTINFEYRPITEDEEQEFMDQYNEITGENKSRLDRTKLCIALEKTILDNIEIPDMKGLLQRNKRGKDKTLLLYHLNQYTAKNSMDYFIHKNLDKFLKRELDFFLKNEVLNVDDFIASDSTQSMEYALIRIKVIKKIAIRIIDFLTQIENFQKRLWEKKKFILQTDYCLTLDKVPDEFYERILNNEDQIEEWKSLYAIDQWEHDLNWQGRFDKNFLKNHPYLMIDTAFFDNDFKLELLSNFDDLDEETDGLLINGENFQALNLLREKYNESIKCVYIDPPYNTGGDDFIYKDSYMHSSWASMLQDRVRLSVYLLKEIGTNFISIGTQEIDLCNFITKTIFGEDNFISTITRIQKTASNKGTFFAPSIDYVVCACKDLSKLEGFYGEVDESLYNKIEESGPRKGQKYRDDVALYQSSLDPLRGCKNQRYFIEAPDGSLLIPPGKTLPSSKKDAAKIEPKSSEEKVWRWSCSTYLQKKNLLVFKKTKTSPLINQNGEKAKYNIYTKSYLDQRKKAGTAPRDIWSDFINRKGADRIKTLGIDYPYSKPCELIEYIFKITQTSNKDTVLDYFAGSGTTAHAIINLNREDNGNRKYILVEMGDYFDTVLKPRIQKVAFASEWKNGVPQNRVGQSHMFKFHRIESYEDTLNNIDFNQPQGKQRRLLYDKFDDYMLHYMLDFETSDSPTLLSHAAFETPFDYTLKIKQDEETATDEPVDLIETFNYLIGMQVKQIKTYNHQDRRYIITEGEVETENGIDKVVTVWRNTADLDLQEEYEWAQEKDLASSVDRVYVNSESHIDKSEPVEITFRNKMEE